MWLSIWEMQSDCRAHGIFEIRSVQEKCVTFMGIEQENSGSMSLWTNIFFMAYRKIDA